MDAKCVEYFTYSWSNFALRTSISRTTSKALQNVHDISKHH